MTQVERKQQALRDLLPVPDDGWLPPLTGPDAGFRNKAKLVVGGTSARPTLGILGADLRTCPLYTPAMHAVIAAVAVLIADADLTPYDVAARRGELKHVLITESPREEYLVRFVLRSREALPRLRKHLDGFLTAAPGVRVVTANLLPEHRAVLEGDVEEVLTEHSWLPMPVGDVVLRLGPRSFFQTNTALAGELYRQAATWVDELAPSSVWDLYCGVGGFALHLAAPGRRVLGVEVSPDAVAAGAEAARAAGLAGVELRAADATAFAVDSDPADHPDLVVVNPPRRGIGEELAGWLERSRVEAVVYSSCRAETLARDLAAMPSLRPVAARLVDLFPHTDHHEVVTLLTRQEGPA